jgi:hypothetical protein
MADCLQIEMKAVTMRRKCFIAALAMGIVMKMGVDQFGDSDENGRRRVGLGTDENEHRWV